MTSRLEAWFRDNEPDDTIVPAATVVLVRDGDAGLETLMLHKNSKLAFGGMWVFPGGRIDDEDREGAESAEDAARRAAVREAVEEADLQRRRGRPRVDRALDAAPRRTPSVRDVVLRRAGARRCGDHRRWRDPRLRVDGAEPTASRVATSVRWSSRRRRG